MADVSKLTPVPFAEWVKLWADGYAIQYLYSNPTTETRLGWKDATVDFDWGDVFGYVHQYQFRRKPTQVSKETALAAVTLLGSVVRTNYDKDLLATLKDFISQQGE